MGIFDKKDIVKITQADLDDAKLSSVAFRDENIKRKAFIDILGARLAMNLLFSKKIKANNLYSLYTIHNVLGQLDISDIYYNGIKIDVRIVFNEDEIFVPKSHFEYGILPDLYLFLALNQDLSSAELLGCIEPKNIDKSLNNRECYFVEQESLTNPKQLKDFFDNFVAEDKTESTIEETEKAEYLFLSLVDDEISAKEKMFLFQQLAKNFILREKLVEFENFELVSQKVANEKTLASDCVLEIIGAQKLFNEDNAAENEGFELETIEFSDTEDESNQGEGKDDKNSFAGTLASGAVIAGSAAVVGGIMAAGAAGAATMAQSSAVGATISATSAVAEGLASVGCAIAENINSTDKFASNDFSTSTDEDLDGLSFIEASDIDLDFLDELSDKDILEKKETQETFETEFLAEEAQSLAPLEEINEIGLLNNNDVFELDALDELPLLEEFAAVDEDHSENNDKSEDTVDMESFDFAMFDEDVLDEAQQVQPPTYAAASDEGTLSFDAIADKGTSERAELECEECHFEELADSDIDEKIESIDNLSSEVDNLLKDIDLSDEQKALLNEINVEMDSEEQEKEEELKYNPSNIDLLTATGPIEDDQDLLNALFQKENMNMNMNGGQNGQDGQLEFGDREKTSASEQTKKRKKIIIAASVASVMLVSLIAGSVISKKNEDITFPSSTQNASISPDMTTSETPTTPEVAAGTDEIPMDAGAALGTQAEASQPSRDMGKAVSDAFETEPMNASVSKVAWEVPEELAYNDGFRKYLQMAGKNLKLTLSNDLLLTTEMAYSTKMIVDLKLSKDGAVQASNVVVSSGSKQIDAIVLQSVKETLMYLKLPSAEVNGQSVNATLIINF